MNGIERVTERNREQSAEKEGKMLGNEHERMKKIVSKREGEKVS